MSPATEKIISQAMALSNDEKRAVIETLAASLPTELPDPEPAWTDEEIAEMMKHEPKSGHEIIEEGLFGAWADLPGLKDGVEWQDEQRRKRLDKWK